MKSVIILVLAVTSSDRFLPRSLRTPGIEIVTRDTQDTGATTET
jgi:hypothetical protein